jgi:HTH-type transcriptional regulator, competence development regulator
MLTPFGKFCRKLRIDNEELLKDMAGKLGVTSSYLSAVENGKRKVPRDWTENIISFYSLNDDQQNELKQVVQDSQKVVKIDFEGYSSEDKNDILALARTFRGLNESEKALIKNILQNHNKGRD